MVLCNICRGIPFDQLPLIPPEYALPGLPDPDDTSGNIYYITLKPGVSEPPMMFGYTHYQSLHELKLSAQDDDCGLCTLIHDEFHKVWKNLKKRRSSWRFFITRREHGQQGFLVWTDGDYGMRRIAAFGYAVKDPDTNPLAKIYRGRLVVSDAKSPACWDIAQHWIHHCNEHHSNCGNGAKKVLLPSRVLYVGKDDSQLHLEVTNDKLLGRYIALSYSWGSKDQNGKPLTFAYRLQSTNLKSYQKNIPITALQNAKTIMDAIHITRRLKINYLWIDALCIEQLPDNAPPKSVNKDFNQQFPKVGQYYSDAYITLASAWSDNSNAGVYNQRQVPKDHYTWIHHNLDRNVKGKLTVVPLDLNKENIMASYVSMDDENITTRGWTLQERYLSPRTLFYGTSQMYWECNEHFLSESGFRATGRMFSADKHTQQISVWESGTKQDPRELWFVLIESFTRRNLGRPSDKFPAVAGLAQEFGRIFKDSYLAGLWKKTVIEDLFWRADRPFMTWANTKNWSPSSNNYRAPSWSWAAFDFDPKLSTEEDSVVRPPDGRILDGTKLAVRIDSGTTPINSNYGEITAAYLRLNAPVLHIHIDVNRTHVHHGKYAFTFKKREIQYKAELDFSFNNVNEVSALSIYAVILARDGLSVPTNPIYLALLVTPVGQDYRRIGTLWIDEKILGSHAPDFSDDWWDINLV